MMLISTTTTVGKEQMEEHSDCWCAQFEVAELEFKRNIKIKQDKAAKQKDTE